MSERIGRPPRHVRQMNTNDEWRSNSSWSEKMIANA